MNVKLITEKDRIKYNSVVSHPLQAYEWGEFRERTGIKVVRRGFYKNGKLDSAFQLTIHPIPHTSFTIGYLPKGEIPTKEILDELKKIGREEKCIFIQLEPNIRQMANLPAGEAGGKWQMEDNLTAHLLTAKYKSKVLTAWVVFIFKDTLYYPYGASSNEHREVMASNLMMWEAIRYGKSLGLKKFDMWGALGPNPDPKDPWFGFHNFKEKYAPEHVEYIGSYDLIINSTLYQLYKIADKLRWFMLRIKK